MISSKSKVESKTDQILDHVIVGSQKIKEKNSGEIKKRDTN
jgi:hypothetical protein